MTQSLAWHVEDVVERSALGDQHATATLVALGQVARGEIPGRSPKTQKAYNAVLRYLEKHPVKARHAIGADAAETIVRLRDPAATGDEICALLVGLPFVGGVWALRVATVVLADELPTITPAHVAAVADGLTDANQRACFLSGTCGRPLDPAGAADPCMAAPHLAGQVVNNARRLQAFRLGLGPVKAFSAPMAWELGE